MTGLLCGSLGASRISDAVATTAKGAWGATRANLMAEIIAERLTGVPYETFKSSAMQWGIETEAHARMAYEFDRNTAVTLTESILHPTIKGSHASPDGLVGDDGLVEIKCPNTSTHIDTLLGAEIEKKYRLQMQWQMAVTGRQWTDFVSFDPRLPDTMRMHVTRVKRDDAAIAELEKQVVQFLSEVESKLQGLQQVYGTQAAA